MPTAAVYLGKPGTRKASGEWPRRQPLRGAGRFRYCVSCHTDSAAYPAPACPVQLPRIGGGHRIVGAASDMVFPVRLPAVGAGPHVEVAPGMYGQRSAPHTGGAPRHGSHFCTFPFATSL